MSPPFPSPKPHWHLPAGARQQPELHKMMPPDQSQPGQVPETPDNTSTGTEPDEKVGESGVQTSAATGRRGEEIHSQEDEVDHHQHRA